jgi:hypothetical protein
MILVQKALQAIQEVMKVQWDNVLIDMENGTGAPVRILVIHNTGRDIVVQLLMTMVFQAGDIGIIS